MGVLSKFKKEVKRLHKYLCAIGNGVAIFKHNGLQLKTDQFKQLEKLENLSSMIYPLLLVEVRVNKKYFQQILLSANAA